MTLPTPSSYDAIITTPFTLTLKQSKSFSIITMHVFTPIVNTKDLPLTYTILANQLPRIYKSMCFNEGNLPFAKEVLQTEIGHLFEHVLLEYLCMLKIKKGCRTAVYEGETNWNWLRDPKGTFHITISSGVRDADIFQEALTNSVSLVRRIMQQFASLSTPQTDGNRFPSVC